MTDEKEALKKELAVLKQTKQTKIEVDELKRQIAAEEREIKIMGKKRSLLGYVFFSTCRGFKAMFQKTFSKENRKKTADYLTRVGEQHNRRMEEDRKRRDRKR